MQLHIVVNSNQVEVSTVEVAGPIWVAIIVRKSICNINLYKYNILRHQLAAYCRSPSWRPIPCEVFLCFSAQQQIWSEAKHRGVSLVIDSTRFQGNGKLLTPSVFEMWILNDSDGFGVEMDIYTSSEKQWPVLSNLGPISQALAFDVFTRPRNWWVHLQWFPETQTKAIPATQPVLFCSDIKAGDVAPLVTQLFSRNFYSEKT